MFFFFQFIEAILAVIGLIALIGAFLLYRQNRVEEPSTYEPENDDCDFAGETPAQKRTTTPGTGNREFVEPDTDAVILGDSISALPPLHISPESIADPALEALGAQSAIWLPPPPVKPRLNGHTPAFVGELLPSSDEAA